MDFDRMLHLCRTQQWSPDDLDWTVPPRRFEPETEQAVVQYFTDMAGIELLAAALFEVQRDEAKDPVLREIFDSFVGDEKRHSVVASRLARHYDVHRYKTYLPNPHLSAFRPRFVEVLRQVTPAIANVYITTGELLLDIALLRSLDDFVDDAMSRQAMRLINRDESRHIAMDYAMTDYYASDGYVTWEASQPARPLAERVLELLAVARFVVSAGPFLRDVFFRPLDMVDPSGRRMLEAFKRIQLLGTKPHIGRRPFARFLTFMRDAFEHPIVGPVLGPLIARILGLDPRVIGKLYDREEERRAQSMSVEELAEEALAVKSGQHKFS